MTAAARFLPDPSEVSLQHVLVPRQSAPLWEQALISLWFLASFIPFPNDELLLYPLVAYFLGSAALRYEQTLPVALRAWPILLIPALAIASTLWSASSTAALRLGIMMTATAVIAIYLCSRLTPREIVRAAFFACAVSAIVALFEVPKVGTTEGLYAEKNIFAVRMQLIAMVCLGVALDRGQNTALRLSALPFVVLTTYLVIQGESATALLLAGGSIVLMVSIWLVWTNVSKIRHLRSLLVLVAGTVVAAGGLVVLNLPNNTLLNDGLFLIGKDTTLTNRTVLWADAARLAEQRPWLGVGAAGFWTPLNGDAESILAYSHKRPGTKFSFHSVYYESLVHLGRVGLAFMIVQIGWVLSGAVRHWLRVPDMPQAFLVLIAVSTFAVTFTESVLFGVIDIGIVLFLVAGVSAVAEPARFRQVLAPPPPPMPPLPDVIAARP
ncbi:MAG: O-antigen ligase family protein [Pseudomonadota bacterium]